MNIVVIRVGGMGDVLLTLPILVALREKHASTHLTLISNPVVTPLAKSWGIAEEVSNYDDLQWEELFVPTGIRKPDSRALFQHTDLAIGWLFTSDNLVRQNLLAAGVKKVIVASGKSPASYTKHAVDYLTEPLGIHLGQTETIVLPYTGPDEPCAYIPPIALHPGSSADYRRWPASSYAALIEHLLRLQFPVLLFAGPSEAEVLKSVLKHLPRSVRKSISPSPKVGMLTVLENLPLLEMAHYLKLCGCYVGHDTGPSHLAGLLRIPTLVLFGPSNPAVWRPLGPTVEIIQQDPLSRLPVAHVLEYVLRLYSCT